MSANTDSHSTPDPPTTASSVHLDQVMLGKVSLTILHILHDALQVPEVAFRVERISRNFKRNAVLPADLFANIVNAALIERPISAQARSILFLHLHPT